MPNELALQTLIPVLLHKSVVDLHTNLKGTRAMRCAKSSSVPKVQLFLSAGHLANPFCISGPMVTHKLFTINYLELRGWALSSHDDNRKSQKYCPVAAMFQNALNIICKQCLQYTLWSPENYFPLFILNTDEVFWSYLWLHVVVKKINIFCPQLYVCFICSNIT